MHFLVYIMLFMLNFRQVLFACDAPKKLQLCYYYANKQTLILLFYALQKNIPIVLKELRAQWILV